MESSKTKRAREKKGKDRMKKKVLRIVTSIKINPDLWKEVKIQAIREELTISEALEEALKEWLVKKRKAQKSRG